MTIAEDNKWRILLTGAESVFVNMALDEVLLHAFIDGNTSPVFRVYEWKRPAITLGYSQRTADFIDAVACAANGVEVTRRLTGGRAVFHTCELGYAIIGSVGDPVFGGNIRNTYCAINGVIKEAYRSLGIAVETGDIHGTNHVPAKYRRSAPCFASPTPFELTVSGMKLTGGAQRRFRGIFLQQGSVRLGPGAEQITDYLSDHEAKAVYRRLLEPGLQMLAMDIPPPDMIDALVEAFIHAVGGAAYNDRLSNHEIAEAEIIANIRYRVKGWIDGTGREPDL